MTSPPNPTTPRPIDYASVPPPRRRVSKLAVLSLTLAVLTSPCALSPLNEMLGGRLTRLLETPSFFAVLWTGVMTLAIVAMKRVSKYKETRFGFRIAVLALIICVFWVVLMCLAFLFEIPPQD